MGSHSDGQDDSYGNSSQDSTLMMREVSAVTWLAAVVHFTAVPYSAHHKTKTPRITLNRTQQLENPSHYLHIGALMEQHFEINRLSERVKTDNPK